jgi:uncharacterized membrane protein
LELARLFGFAHPALVHFPLVLLLVSVGLEAIGFFRRAPRFTWAAQITLLLGTVATLFAFVAGNFAEIWAARDGVPQDPMEFHELLATITSWSFVFLTAGRLFLGVGTNRRGMAAYMIAATAACGLLILTGHRGAMLVYQHGAGVHAAGLHVLPTHEDLAVLMQKQELDALFYSNMMHHIFGWMVLILSGMLLVDMVSPAAGDRLRRLAPVLLLCGGVFLMIFSDQDAWPLYHVRPFRPITDKEVLMHKTYAVLMLVVGLRGLWRRRGEKPISRRMQSRMMAIFALVGGALLFTHVHSNAPYANVAAGVYIHHTVMGLIALLIGAVKLSEDLLGQRPPSDATLAPEESSRRLRLARGLAWAYPCLMLTESIFLINYNEGLPWFLGYANLSITAPHRGLVAALGLERRAELCFNPTDQRLDVYLYGQNGTSSKPLAVRAATAVVKTGTDSTAVPLVPVQGEPAHFTGQATFLRDVVMFQTEALFWPADRPASNPPLNADFEPWIDPLAARPHTRLAYVCPMHENQGSSRPGPCPICGMELVPNRPARPYGVLHDAGYACDLALSVAGAPIVQPAPGQTARLTFTPRRSDGSVVKDLAVVHTKKLHLIVVSRDLSFFDHVHPEPQPDGTLALDYRFPTPGEFLLYADLTPVGDRNQVFRLPVTVSGTPPIPQPLIATPAQGKSFGPYRVQLAMNPDPPARNDETSLTFTISRDGVPVGDLEPFLGAGGHCVILSEDTNAYLHSHPLTMDRVNYGPTVTFHATFRRAGRYKVWAQFLHHHTPLTADFVIDVP